MNNYSPPMKGTADSLAKHGRYGDSMLVHMNPIEVLGIASLSPGGKLTTNPVTGQPEAFLPFLAPMLGGAVGTAALGSTLGPALAGAVGSGLASWAESGDIQQGLMSGITGYGIGSALGTLGKDAATSAAEGVSNVGSGVVPTGLGSVTPDPSALGVDLIESLPFDPMSSGGVYAGGAGSPYIPVAETLPGATIGDIPFRERMSSYLSDDELIPELVKKSPLIFTGEMGRSELQAQRDLEDLSGDKSEKE